MLIRVKEKDDRLLITLHHQNLRWILHPSGAVQGIDSLVRCLLQGETFASSRVDSPICGLRLWEREYLQDNVLQPHLAYWKLKLADLVPLQLPYDYPRPVQPTFRTERHFMPIGKALTDKLKAVSLREGVTMFMTLLAAYQTLLFRNSRQSAIPVMTFAAGLPAREFKNLLGIFVNFLPMSTNLDGNPDFRELLKRVRETTLDAYGHHELPFRY